MIIALIKEILILSNILWCEYMFILDFVSSELLYRYLNGMTIILEKNTVF
jgi:hypothetical protein